MLHRLDAQSRHHLRTFAGQVAFLALVGIPMLLIDRRAPVLYLLQLRTMFGFSAIALFVLGALSRQPLRPAGLCIWDHLLAFLLLRSGCSLALWLLG